MVISPTPVLSFPWKRESRRY